MANTHRVLLLTFLLLFLTPSSNSQERGNENNDNYGGFDWAKPFNYSKEDHEMGLGGRRFTRLLDILTVDFAKYLQVKSVSNASDGVLKTELRSADEKPIPAAVLELERRESTKTGKTVDFTHGTGRTAETCDDPDQYGGVSAIMDAPCNYALWQEYRQPLLQYLANDYVFDIEARKRKTDDVEPKLDVYLIKLTMYFHQLIKEYNELIDKDTSGIDTSLSPIYHFFNNLCIPCTNEPLLQCSPDNKCVCWDYYFSQTIGDEGNSTVECRIPISSRCHHTLGARCVENGFCDQAYACRCKTRTQCDKGSLGRESSVFVLILALVAVVGIYNN